MTIINIRLEDNLSAAQVAKIKDLLKMIRGVASVSGDESYQLANLNTSEPSGRTVLPSGQEQNIDLDRISPSQKKHIISQAIAWGSKHGKITLSDLERLSPEELMSLSTKFLSDMTDNDRDLIFGEMMKR